VGIDLSLGEYLIVSLGVMLGALAQGAVGFGANLLAVPVSTTGSCGPTSGG
jgi:hypothetical protein